MSTSISMKWSKEDQSLQAWRETQPEKDSDLIRAALYALMEKRSGGGNSHNSDLSPDDQPEWATRLLNAIDGIPAAIKEGIVSVLETEPTITTWKNEQSTEKVEPEFKAKRPEKKNHHEPPPKPPDPPEDALAVATNNFLDLFA